MSNVANASETSKRPRQNRQVRRANLQRLSMAVSRSDVADISRVVPPDVDALPMLEEEPLKRLPTFRTSGVAPGAVLPHIEPIEAEHLAVLDLLGQAPVTFYRIFVDIAGGIGINAAIWLSHAVGLHKALPRSADGWFFNDVKECKEICGLSVKEFATARVKLARAGLIESRPHGRRVQFRLNTQALARALVAQSQEDWAESIRKAAQGVAAKTLTA